ncbi:MAG TPA: hypothetical protein VFO95_01745, partial [Gemmatimonadales bacterium]|nr:hypothetical protein [Gemmatimonadales bacterium]
MSARAAATEVAGRLRAAESLNATLAWSPAALEAEAARLDALPDRGPLGGMPIAVKDNIVTLDHP